MPNRVLRENITTSETLDDEPGLVYFIQPTAGGPIKIGYTAGDPFRRLAALQTGAPDVLRLLAVVPGNQGHETHLHERFAHLRMHGEWFRPAPDLLELIETATIKV